MNANAGTPVSELFAGVVNGFWVVRSALSKQWMSASALPKAAVTSAQVSVAWAETETKKDSAAAGPQILANIEP
ncbi:MAG TPA: hypothetical protein VE325_05790, partial [Burkholderiales bacterium]|nr:hypothetical protein [Burkholderiales bacterium]